MKTKTERKIKYISIFLNSFVSLLSRTVDEADCTHGKVNKISSVLSSRLCCLKMYTVKRRKTTGVQSGCSTADLKDQSTQCGDTNESYGRGEKKDNFSSYENLLRNYLWDRDFILPWLKDERLIASSGICPTCGSEMNWVERGDRSDGYVWECTKQINSKRLDVRGALEREVALRKRT